MKPVKPRWIADSAPLLLHPTSVGTPAQSLTNGLKAEGLTRKTSKGTGVGYMKLVKQTKFAAAVRKKNKQRNDR